MKLINAALKEKNLKLKDLPTEIVTDIETFRKSIFDYNVLCDEFEEDSENEELSNRLEVMSGEIESTDKAISEKILAYQVQSNEPTENKKVVEKKKKSSTGWLVFAGAVLVVTLGAVNVFKKK
jgi:hypothetical protein